MTEGDGTNKWQSVLVNVREEQAAFELMGTTDTLFNACLGCRLADKTTCTISKHGPWRACASCTGKNRPCGFALIDNSGATQVCFVQLGDVVRIGDSGAASHWVMNPCLPELPSEVGMVEAKTEK